LLAVPAATFILPDLFGGHLLLTGDNLQQNFPLRVLDGRMLRQGHLPFWNEYIFSGTPLLAGFNAGSFYLLTALFVVFPDRVAWITTEVVLFSAIAVGMYAFLRALALSTVAAVFGAATFAFSGVVLSQVNHLDMTEGFASLPFMLLAILFIVRDGRWRWAVLFGVAYAFVILGGAPEAMLDEGLLLIVYAAMVAGRDRQRWLRVLTRGGAGVALALALAAVQWLPGLSAISNSQRSGLGSAFASTGSFPPANSLLSVVPYLFGGYGKLGTHRYFGTLNLPEVGIYVGILPLIALLTMWHPRWPSRLAHSERLRWYAIALLGVLLAFGPSTPLEHVFNAIPVYGHQRLQGRNMIDLSLALCVLFAGWLDRRPAPATEDALNGTDGPAGAEEPVPARGEPLLAFGRAAALVPLVLVVGLGVWAWADPNSLVRAFTPALGSPLKDHAVRLAVVIALGFTALAALVAWLRPFVRQRRWLVLAALAMAADLGFVAGTSQLLNVPPNAVLSGRTPVETYVAAHLGPGARFDVYDPLGYARGPSDVVTGLPDVNMLAGLHSVGGYASIVGQSYNRVTFTHTPGDLNVPLLAAGGFDRLDLQDILTAPEYLLVPLHDPPATLHEVDPKAEPGRTDPALPMGIGLGLAINAYPAHPAPRPALEVHGTDAWFFGTALRPAGATVLLARGAGQPSRLRFGALRHGGTVQWGAPVAVPAGALSASGGVPAGAADGLEVQVLAGRLPPHQAVVSVGARSYELDGSLSDALRPGTWRQQGNVEGYTLFTRVQPPRPLSIVNAGNGPGAPRLQVLMSGANGESVRVQGRTPSVLVRAVAWDPGWHATLTVNGGTARPVSVLRRGLVQQVRVPAGSVVVAFAYRPPHWEVASAISTGAALLLVLLLVDVVLRRRGRLTLGGLVRRVSRRGGPG
jgi:hypothetical protein